MVYIDSANSSKSLLALALGSPIHMNDRATFEKIIKRIVYWNTKVTYSEYNNNCQTFSFDLLDAISRGLSCCSICFFLKLTTFLCKFQKFIIIITTTTTGDLACGFNGTIGQYFNRIKKGGVLESTHTNPFTGETVSFKNHVQLDNYIIMLLTEYAKQNNLPYKTSEEQGHVVAAFSTDERYKEDYALLKAFDRGFWLRHNKSKSTLQAFQKKLSQLALLPRDNKNIAQEQKIKQSLADLEPKIKECSCLTIDNLIYCPFGDPAATMSIPTVNVEALLASSSEVAPQQ